MYMRGRHGVPFCRNAFRIPAKAGVSSWKTWVRPVPRLLSTGIATISTFASPHSSNLQQKQQNYMYAKD